MATLTVSASTNFSGLPLIDITDIDFTNIVSRVLVTATFSTLQFNDLQIQNDLAIDGSSGRNGIVVNGGSLDASGWTFTNWSTNDVVTLNGSNSSDTIIGSSQNDTINGLAGSDELIGGLGVDKLFGGDGDDTIRYVDATQLVAGEIINGGAGTQDWLIIEGSGVYKFDAATITGMEVLQYEGGGEVRLTASQIGPSGISEIVGNLMVQTVKLLGQTVDTSVLTFTTWDDALDRIYVVGENLVNNALTGSSHAENFTGGSLDDVMIGGGGNDVFFSREGVDTSSGGEGDDTFAYSASAIQDGETVDGGAGTDTIDAFKGTCELWRLNISSVETLSFGVFTPHVEVAGAQIGVQTGRINTVSGNLGATDLTVRGSTADLTAVVFNNWGALNGVTLQGDAAVANTLTGSAVADRVVGGDLGDTLNGGKGVDTIIGGLGKDGLTGGNQGDYFVFLTAADSGIGGNRDLIKDFSVGNDIVDLSAIDALAGGGDDAFTFLGEAAAFTGAGQVRYEFSDAGNTIVRINLDADPDVEMEIGMLGLKALTSDEFML